MSNIDAPTDRTLPVPATDEMKCHECGHAMRRGRRRDKVTVEGETVAYMLTGYLCSNCDEVVFIGDDAASFEAAFDEAKRRADARSMPPDRIARIRESLVTAAGKKVTQRRASEVLGGGEIAFHRYEAGKALPSRPTINLLLLLERHPHLFAELETLAKPAADDKKAVSGRKGTANTVSRKPSAKKPAAARKARATKRAKPTKGAAKGTKNLQKAG